MLKPIIEFCASNMHHGTDLILKRLEQDPDMEVIEYGCLGNCGECYLFPFALVNGETVAGETAEELYLRILEEVEEQRAEREALDRPKGDR